MLIQELIYNTFSANLYCKDGFWYTQNSNVSDGIAKYLTNNDSGNVDIHELGIRLRDLIFAREKVKKALIDTDEHHHDYLVKITDIYFGLSENSTAYGNLFAKAADDVLATINNPLTHWNIGLDRKSKVLIFKQREVLDSLPPITQAIDRGALIELTSTPPSNKTVYLFHVGDDFNDFLELLTKTLKVEKNKL